MEPKFIPGDKVRLISGGPDMTVRGMHYDVVTEEYKEDKFDCIWFEKNKDGRKEVQYCPFYEYELIRVGGATDGIAA